MYMKNIGSTQTPSPGYVFPPYEQRYAGMCFPHMDRGTQVCVSPIWTELRGYVFPPYGPRYMYAGMCFPHMDRATRVCVSPQWTEVRGYVFPPFALIGRCLAKVMKDQAVLMLVTPTCQTQAWYPRLLAMSVDYAVRVITTTKKIYYCHQNKNVALWFWTETATSGLESVRHRAAVEGLSGHAASLVVGSWREGTQGAYIYNSA